MPAGAQQTRIHPGVEVGFAYTDLHYTKSDPSWTADAHFEPSAGINAELLFLDGVIRVVPSIRWFRATAKIDVNSGPDPVSQFIGEIDMTLDYLTLPVMVRYKPARNAGIFLFAGPEFGYLMSAKQKSVIREIRNESDVSVIENGEEDVTDTLKSVNLSGIAGVGQQRKVGSHLVSAQLRYNYGFVGVVDDPVEAAVTQFQTRAFEFILGFAW